MNTKTCGEEELGLEKGGKERLEMSSAKQLKQLNPADRSYFHTAGEGKSRQSLTCCYYGEITGKGGREQQRGRKEPT